MDRDSDIGGCVVAKNKGVDPECNKEKLVRCGVFTEDFGSVEIADGDVGGSLCQGCRDTG